MEHKVLDSVWFDKIGIVKIETRHSGVKWYIGVGMGKSQYADEQMIAAWGNPFYPQALKNFLEDENVGQ